MFLDRSTDLRLCENWTGLPTVPDSWILSMQFARSERCSSLVSDVSSLSDDREVISLYSSIIVVMVLVIGVEISEIWFADADRAVRDGN